jgi:hypothetical protein
MGCLMKVFIFILYKNVFQNPDFFPTQVRLSPKQSTSQKVAKSDIIALPKKYLVFHSGQDNVVIANIIIHFL